LLELDDREPVALARVVALGEPVLGVVGQVVARVEVEEAAQAGGGVLVVAGAQGVDQALVVGARIGGGGGGGGGRARGGPGAGGGGRRAGRAAGAAELRGAGRDLAGHDRQAIVDPRHRRQGVFAGRRPSTGARRFGVARPGAGVAAARLVELEARADRRVLGRLSLLDDLDLARERLAEGVRKRLRLRLRGGGGRRRAGRPPAGRRHGAGGRRGSRRRRRVAKARAQERHLVLEAADGPPLAPHLRLQILEGGAGGRRIARLGPRSAAAGDRRDQQEAPAHGENS